MEPIERLYYGDDEDDGRRQRRSRSRLGYVISPGTGGDVSLVPGRRVGGGGAPGNDGRADDRIRDDIHERLARLAGFESVDVEVRVQDGAVVLDGLTSDRRARWIIADIAASVAGVAEVVNRLRVTPRAA
jgi:osmotically-inducible protein OsmY